MRRWRVLLADDHDVVLAGLRLLLDHGDFEIVDAVRDGRALVKRAVELRPDVVVTDVSMPLLNGLDAARQIRRLEPGMKIVFLTMHTDVGYATEALAVGKCAYVLKSSVAEELPEAIHRVLGGHSYIARAIEEPVLRALEGRTESRVVAGRLTRRQREVLQLLAEGRSMKEIADTLLVSHRTVEYHKYRIMAALGAHSVAELARYAARQGLVT